MSRRPSLALAAAAALAFGAATRTASAQVTPQGATGYRVTSQQVLGGDGGWDYVALDTAGHRLFITRTDRVMVVDEGTGKRLGEIPGLDRGHGVAFAYPQGHGFVTSGEDSTVTMFDLKTLQVLGHTKAAIDDDAVLYDPASRRVFTFNGDANSATAIDATTGAKIGDIPLGGKPEFGVTDGKGHLFVNIEDKNEVAELDPAKLAVLRRWSIAPCEEPSGLAIDVANARLFSVCRSKVMAISNAKTGKLVTTVPIGAGVDAARFDPQTKQAFASNGDGTLTVIAQDSPDHYHVVGNIETMPGARTMELDPVSHRLYTVSAKFGERPAAATKENPRRRAPMIPDSFTLLTLQP